MTVRAGDAGRVHTALQERAVFIRLAVDLPVDVIETGLEQSGEIAVEDGRARRRVPGNHLATRVTGRAGLDFGRGPHPSLPRLRRRVRERAPGDTRLWVHFPMAVIARLQPVGHTHPVPAVG